MGAAGFERAERLGVDAHDRRGKQADEQPKPSVTAARNAAAPSLETLRAKLDAAILAEQWAAVTAIAARIREIERADVVDLDAERRRRETR